MKELVIKVLPSNQVDNIKGFKRRIKMWMTINTIKVMSKNQLLSSIYYLFNSEFRREHYSVLNGKLNHLKEVNENKSNSFLIRRNIHRLEKGLLMRPMKRIFAKGYIEETVYCYNALVEDYYKNKYNELSTLNWAYDVLSEYFTVIDHSDKKINEIREYFYNIKKIEFKNNHKKLIPYKRELEIKDIINYEDFLKLSEFRRSVRWFKQEPVPREVIDKAINVATLSPSACNRQPFIYRIFDEPTILKQVKKLPMGVKGYEENIPVMVAVIGKLSAYPNERDRHLIYIDSSLSVMSFIYSLEIQGVSSCIINWPDIAEKESKINKLLNLKNDERVTMMIALGFPDSDGKVAYSNKKDLSEIRKYN